jgi:hypothetical protein
VTRRRVARYLQAVRDLDRALTPSKTPPTIREATGPFPPLRLDLWKFMGPTCDSQRQHRQMNTRRRNRT